MTVRVRFFASLRELMHREETTQTIDGGGTVDEVWSALCREHPDLEAHDGSVSFAVNREYVGRDHRLRDGDELALIPPVSGGC